MSATAGYTFKPDPYSSHLLLLSIFPGHGGGARVLDVGCAGGYLGAVLAARGFAVTGIERPGAAGPDFPATVRLIEADLEAGLPITGEPFDWIVCADVLEHLRHPEDLLRALRLRLAPGGKLVVSIPNSGHFWFRLNILFGRFPRHDKGLFDRTHLRYYMWRNVRELLSNGGFRIVSCAPSGTPVGLRFPRWADTFPIRAAEALAYGCARVWSTLFAYQFVLTAEPF